MRRPLATVLALLAAAAAPGASPALAGGDGSPAPKGAPPVNNSEKPQHENRLARESSPYLLQHARNPVDWYPWGEEAFAKAKAEDKPIFLSIGYSTCHWCHVMERESFENEEIAAYLADHFVSIKVDREERPDVDAVYMTAVQATGQGGGWPLTAFLDHDLRPFFLGTYYPPEDRWGRPGFPTVLRKIHEAWTTRREDVARAGGELEAFVRGAFAPPGEAAVGEATLATAVRQFQGRFDAARGGFGEAPKFPRAHALSFLLAASLRPGLEKGRGMALETLRAMARGGMYDQVGGGFHRYSTDGSWLVPHFEKMLYDQALLATACVEAFQASGEEDFARTARETLDYVLRDMTHPDGGFFSAEDADSEGVEGKFYLWTTAEIREVLGAEAGDAIRVFGMRDGGNFHGEAEEAPEGGNILHLPKDRAALAKDLGIAPGELARRIDAWRAKLLPVRAKRVRPHRDDKVLAGWNGMAAAAFARAGRVLGEPRYLEAAARSVDFVRTRLRVDGRLRRSWREGVLSGNAFLEDHAFLGLALVELLEATGDPARLEEALRTAREIPKLFGDEASGALFDAPADARHLLARTRETDDWAVPSGNSAAALLLLRLGALSADPHFSAAGRGILKSLSGSLDRLPMGAPFLLLALDHDLGPAREIVLAGDPASAEFRAMERAVAVRFLPRTVILRRPAGPDGDRVAAALPWLAGYGPVDGKAAAYVCTAGVCRTPVLSPEALEALLDGK